MKRYLPFAIIVVVFLVSAGAGTAVFFWRQRAEPAKSVPEGGKPGAQPAHTLGSPDARVKIEEFGDFQCPSCAALSPALIQAEQKHRGRICVIFRQFPLASQKQALPGPSAAEAAGLLGRFWQMHDLLYGSQLLWSKAEDVREFFNQFAKSLGLDVERFKIEAESEQVKARIIADQQRAASLGVNRTPAIFIAGGRLPDTSLNQKALQEAIDAAVKQKAR